MDKTTNQITMLGTGNAMVSQIYNTCFVLQTPSTLMLVHHRHDSCQEATGREESYPVSYGGENAR